jgi:ADP-ribose pyrophosphatase YjhB (NUDIX family)
VHWDSPVPVVAAIVEHDGEIVLVNDRAWPPDLFGVVAGFLEPEESPEAGVLREVKEELGLDGEILRLVGVYAFAQKNQVIMAWHVRAGGEIRLGGELRAVKRVAPERLKPWSFGTGPAVRDWLTGRADTAR